MYNSIALSHPAPQRLLIEYIVHFNHVWQLFDVMDSSHDHRLSGGAPPFCPFACCLEKRSLREKRSPPSRTAAPAVSLLMQPRSSPTAARWSVALNPPSMWQMSTASRRIAQITSSFVPLSSARVESPFAIASHRSHLEPHQLVCSPRVRSLAPQSLGIVSVHTPGHTPFATTACGCTIHWPHCLVVTQRSLGHD